MLTKRVIGQIKHDLIFSLLPNYLATDQLAPANSCSVVMIRKPNPFGSQLIHIRGYHLRVSVTSGCNAGLVIG